MMVNSLVITFVDIAVGLFREAEGKEEERRGELRNERRKIRFVSERESGCSFFILSNNRNNECVLL